MLILEMLLQRRRSNENPGQTTEVNVYNKEWCKFSKYSKCSKR